MPDPLEQLRMPIVPIEPRPEFAAMLLRKIEGTATPTGHEHPTVRYFVDDLDAAVAFYRDVLEFEEELRPSPAFAMLYRGELRLLLSLAPERPEAHTGALPEPGGWNRIALRVDDLGAAVGSLRRHGARFRTGIVAGMAVNTVLLEDPAGNPVELFEPRAGYHERKIDAGDITHPNDPSTTTEEHSE